MLNKGFVVHCFRMYVTKNFPRPLTQLSPRHGIYPKEIIEEKKGNDIDESSVTYVFGKYWK